MASRIGIRSAGSGDPFCRPRPRPVPSTMSRWVRGGRAVRLCRPSRGPCRDGPVEFPYRRSPRARRSGLSRPRGAPDHVSVRAPTSAPTIAAPSNRRACRTIQAAAERLPADAPRDRAIRARSVSACFTHGEMTPSPRRPDHGNILLKFNHLTCSPTPWHECCNRVGDGLICVRLRGKNRYRTEMMTP
jgi:hypothetical protein